MLCDSAVSIKIQNCKNILNGDILIFKNALNIKYAANGTGKSTIADAIKFSTENLHNELMDLKTFGVDSVPSVEYYVNIDGTWNKTGLPQFSQIEIFNENFVKDIVFQENQVIKSSFDVFIKSPDFENKRSKLNQRLSGLKVDITEDSTIREMRDIFFRIDSKIKQNQDGKISQRGFGKDILNKNNAHVIPLELEKFRYFFESNSVVNWVEWKLNGFSFDENKICPFCANILMNEEYQIEKDVFSSTYSKSMIKNKKDFEEFLLSLKKFMNKTDFDRYFRYTQQIFNKDDFQDEFIHFINEVKTVHRKINEIVNFNSYNVDTKNLTEFKNIIIGLKISIESIKIFNSENSIEVYNLINSKIDTLLSEIIELKKEISQLNNIIKQTIDTSKTDINKFLVSAGINYQFNITTFNEDNATTELRYIGETDTYEVSEIRKHLSWGEKNSIALILFMYSTIQKSTDLIILDDPISSFDKNKKYAIMSRLFKNVTNNKTFLNKTVLFLTHDLEPIIDLKIKKRFNDNLGKAYFLTNKNNILIENEISTNLDLKSMTILYSDDFNDNNLHIIYRITALRKYIEYTNKEYSSDSAYNILSSLMKGRSNPTISREDVRGLNLNEIETAEGINKIKEFIPEFDYNSILITEYTLNGIMNQYKKEINSYYKMQLFRVLINLENIELPIINDDVLEKFANESFHIENDYSHCLDYTKFDIIPPYILKKIDKYMNELSQNIVT